MNEVYLAFILLAAFFIVGIALLLYVARKDFVKQEVKTDINKYISDNDFISLFGQHLQRLEGHSLNDIADALLVSRPTISRWKCGRNLPHPALRETILNKLQEII